MFSHDYDLYIVDLDGTLYNMKAVKLCMAFKMALRPWNLRKYSLVQRYRKLFKQGINGEEAFRRLPFDARSAVEEWMIRRPGKLLHLFRNRKLISELEDAMRLGSNVIVYSDHPVKEKLKALGFNPTKAYSSEEVGTMKPNPEGIKTALYKDNLYSANAIVVGDRESKDGRLADNLGFDALII